MWWPISHTRRLFRRAIAASLVSGLLFPGIVAAQWLDGNNLLRVCETSGKFEFHPGVCSGYLMGALDLEEALANNGLLKEPLFCMPEDVDISQLTDIVMKYLNEHPESRHESAGKLEINALQEAFPCKR